MKARVFVTLKNGVLDPQGKAIHHALEGLGFSGVHDVRVVLAPERLAKVSRVDHQPHAGHGTQRAGDAPERVDGRLHRRAAGELQLAGELDDQDRVLARQAHQHDQADLHEDVVVASGVVDPDHSRQQPHRHDHDDRQRQV